MSDEPLDATPFDPAPLTDPELEVWAAVATLLERLPATLDAQLQRDSGLTHFEYGVLVALDHAPGRTLRLSTLAGYASVTLSRLSRAITRLEARGLVRRVTDPDDGRFTLGVLSDAGHDTVVRATPGHQALVRHLVFDNLTPAQARQFGIVAKRVATAISPEPSWQPPHTR